MMEQKEIRADNRLPEMFARLHHAYGRAAVPGLEPVGQLLFGLLTASFSQPMALSAVRSLRRGFRTWADVEAASPSDIAACLGPTPHTLPAAHAVRDVLRAIQQARGLICLEFLQKMPRSRARDWLEALPGIDQDIALATLCFGWPDRSRFVLDMTASRVVRRLGLCAPGAAESALVRELVTRSPAHWEYAEFVSFAKGLERVARDVCHQGAPACNDCVLADLCPQANRIGGEVIAFSPARKDSAASGQSR